MRREAEDNVAGRLLTGVATFFPGYFALVMATGIVSIAAHLLISHRLGVFFLAVNVPAYVVLWGITGLRMAWFRGAFLFDLTHHARGVTFLTMVAATMVLGSQLVILLQNQWLAQLLWWFGVLLWVILIYTFFTVITVSENKPRIEDGINGAWLLPTVATESIAVLGTLIAPSAVRPEIILFVAVCSFFVGVMFYLIFITLVLYRWSFFTLRAEKLTPPYWINMGALAITTLAGSRLLLSGSQWAFLEELAPFLKGFTLFFWATCAWWSPFLIIMGVWRHVIRRVPLTYDPQYWSLVFPLGMFAVATQLFIEATGLQFLAVFPRVFLVLALVAWTLTSVGLVRQFFAVVRGTP